MGLGFCQTKFFLSCSLDKPNLLEMEQIGAHDKQNSDIKLWKNENISETRQRSNWSIFNKQFNPILPGLLNTLQTWGGRILPPLLIRLFFILEA